MNRRLLNRLLEGVVVGLAFPTLAMGAAMSSGEYGAARDSCVDAAKARHRK